MNTKFILHGGETKQDCASNTQFYQEMISTLQKPLVFLGIYHALDEERRQARFEKTQKAFLESTGRVDTTFILGSDDIEQTKQYFAKANIIYLHGGSTLALTAYLSLFADDLQKLMRGKVIAGSSAGAYVLCKAYYSRDRQVVDAGLGMLPTNIIGHWDPAYPDGKEVLEETNDLPTHYIPETHYVVLHESI